jgi:hypothetical protein
MCAIMGGNFYNQRKLGVDWFYLHIEVLKNIYLENKSICAIMGGNFYN